jgi:hypothetical protein
MAEGDCCCPRSEARCDGDSLKLAAACLGCQVFCWGRGSERFSFFFVALRHCC